MSHFTRVTTSLREAELLIRALNALGISPVETYDRPQSMRGYGGQTRSAEIIVRKDTLIAATGARSLYADMGFTRTKSEDPYQLIIDGDDQARYFDDKWQQRLTQEYGHAAALRFAETNGFEVRDDAIEHNGVRRLVLTRSV